MMDAQPSTAPGAVFEAECLELIRRLETERLPKSRARLQSAQRSVDAIKRERDALLTAISIHRRGGEPAPTCDEIGG